MVSKFKVGDYVLLNTKGLRVFDIMGQFKSPLRINKIYIKQRRYEVNMAYIDVNGEENGFYFSELKLAPLGFKRKLMRLL